MDANKNTNFFKGSRERQPLHASGRLETDDGKLLRGDEEMIKPISISTEVKDSLECNENSKSILANAIGLGREKPKRTFKNLLDSWGLTGSKNSGSGECMSDKNSNKSKKSIKHKIIKVREGENCQNYVPDISSIQIQGQKSILLENGPVSESVKNDEPSNERIWDISKSFVSQETDNSEDGKNRKSRGAREEDEKSVREAIRREKNGKSMEDHKEHCHDRPDTPEPFTAFGCARKKSISLTRSGFRRPLQLPPEAGTGYLNHKPSATLLTRRPKQDNFQSTPDLFNRKLPPIVAFPEVNSVQPRNRICQDIRELFSASKDSKTDLEKKKISLDYFPTAIQHSVRSRICDSRRINSPRRWPAMLAPLSAPSGNEAKTNVDKLDGVSVDNSRPGHSVQSAPQLNSSWRDRSRHEQ